MTRSSDRSVVCWLHMKGSGSGAFWAQSKRQPVSILVTQSTSRKWLGLNWSRIWSNNVFTGIGQEAFSELRLHWTCGGCKLGCALHKNLSLTPAAIFWSIPCARAHWFFCWSFLIWPTPQLLWTNWRPAQLREMQPRHNWSYKTPRPAGLRLIVGNLSV